MRHVLPRPAKISKETLSNYTNGECATEGKLRE